MDIKLRCNPSKSIGTLFWFLASNFNVIGCNLLTQLISTLDKFSQFLGLSPICEQTQTYTGKPASARAGFVWFVCGEGDMASIWLDIPNHTIFTLDTKSFSTKQKRRGKEMLPFFEFSDTSLIENWHCQAPGKDIGFKKDKRLHWSHREYHEQIPQCYLIG